jgi:hypothetical protein
MIKAQAGHTVSDLGLHIGAGDGNRTRTISLGISTIHAATQPDLRRRVPVSDREGPLFTGVNGPLMARRSWPELRSLTPCQPDHPVAVDPPEGVAGLAHGGKMERPTGRTILLLWARSARLAPG